MSDIRTSFPPSLATKEQRDMYQMFYDDITNEGVVLQYRDRHMLAEAAANQVEINALREDLRIRGEHIETTGDRGHTVTKKNPSREALEKMRPAQLRIMKAFSMSPADRGKATASPQVGKKTDDGFGDV